jgi:mannose-6-phosphate isomerase-like protein (cupin superfamily)
MTNPLEEHRPEIHLKAPDGLPAADTNRSVNVQADPTMRSKMQELLGTRIKPDIGNVLSLKTKEFDVNAVLNLSFPAKYRNLLFTDALAEVIRQRWEAGEFILRNTSTVDMTQFEGLPVVTYEFMPTQVTPDSVWFGIGKLHIKFPAGCKEAKESHMHPGGRIVVVVKGKGTFSAYGDNFEEGAKIVEPIEEGSVIIMPKLTPHNFAALDEEDMYVVSIHVGYAGVEDEAFIPLEEKEA